MLEVFIGFALYASTNKKRHAELHRMKVWGGRDFAVSRKRESYGKNLLRKLTLDGILSRINTTVAFMPRNESP